MKKFFVLAALVALVSGCTVKVGDSSPDTTTSQVANTIKSTTPVATDSVDDLFLSDSEYSLFYSYMDGKGYNNIISQETAQTIGEIVCDFVSISQNGNDLVTYMLALADQYGIDPETFGQVGGALAAVMCDTDFNRLRVGT